MPKLENFTTHIKIDGNPFAKNAVNYQIQSDDTVGLYYTNERDQRILKGTLARFENWTDLNDIAYTTFPDLIADLDLFLFSNDATIISPLELNGAVPVNIQDQHTPVVIAKFSQRHDSTTLDGAVAIDDLTIVVTDATGFVAGDYITLFDPGSVRFSLFYALGVAGTTITLDTPIDFAYPDGTFVDAGITDMAVNGSVTTEIFGLRGTGEPPGVELSFDVTRLIFTMVATDTVDFSKFGDIVAGITNGLVCRKVDDEFHNIFNLKTNRDIANIMFDYMVSEASNPAQGENGFVARLTFAGPSKIGVTQRLDIGEDLQILIQDDLSTILTFEIVAEGHIVTD